MCVCVCVCVCVCQVHRGEYIVQLVLCVGKSACVSCTLLLYVLCIGESAYV